MLLNTFPNRSMKHAKVHVKGVNNFMKQLRVLLLENRALKLLISYSLTFLLRTLFWPVDGLWVLDHNVEPNVLLDLFDYVSELKG